MLRDLIPAINQCSKLNALFLNLNKITFIDPDFAVAVAKHPSLSFVSYVYLTRSYVD